MLCYCIGRSCKGRCSNKLAEINRSENDFFIGNNIYYRIALQKCELDDFICHIICAS